MLALNRQQDIWKVGIAYGLELRKYHEKKGKLILGKTLIDAAFFQALECYTHKETINCFITGFVNGYLSL